MKLTDKKVISRSEKETADLAKEIANHLTGGEVLALIGELGVGKTVFSRTLIESFGVKDNINSPTFVLMKIYRSRNRQKIKNLCHIDAYRLKSAQELIDIGIMDYLSKKDTITVIEWADKVLDILPKEKIEIHIKNTKKNLREFAIKGMVI